MTTVLIVIAAVLAAFYLLLRFNSLWIGLVDRARRNQRDTVPLEYEAPRYYQLNNRGEIDYHARWPGWDGWYFFVIPTDRRLPVKMIRASIMTGLYGLEGIDNYEKLAFRLQTSEGIEFLTLSPTEVPVNGSVSRLNHLSQQYLPKWSDLRIRPDQLSVTVTGTDPDQDDIRRPFGHISGRWPNYTFDFTNPESQIAFTLQYEGRKLLWWADVPGVFTYFAAFGEFRGLVKYQRGTRMAVGHQMPDDEKTYELTGTGCFEHGFARKMFDFDPLFTPVRLLKRVAPEWKPIRYHYELFVDDGPLRGGFMHARGFGINWRNLGGVYAGNQYAAIRSVKVEYSREVDLMVNCGGESTFEAPREWKVRAKTPEGDLAYTGRRDFSPSTIADNMTFYTFTYEGTYQGNPIQGRGYGEYVHL
jgi:hypothetical protein